MKPSTPATERVRLDRWLVASRCYKTRPIAQRACEDGAVKLNGERADAGKMVKVGDRVEAPRGDRGIHWEIVALDVKRGDATHAQTLYADHTPPPAPVIAPDAARERGAGRPTKRDARLLRALQVWDPDA